LSNASFSELPLQPELLQNLTTLGYLEMTQVQAESLPLILQGSDLIAQAKTGSGKTAAFGLGLLSKLKVKKFRVQCLILCPTRELADQVAEEVRRLARSIHNIKILTLCGGKPFGPQLGSLEHGAHIVVGTPGRIDEHLRKGSLKLDHVDMFILDEADRMLEMGFQEELDAIVDYLPQNRQTLLFSATFPDKIKSISEQLQTDPILIKVEHKHAPNAIEQKFFKVNANIDRLDAVKRLLMEYQPDSAVIFCTTKIETQDLADELSAANFSAIALHGDLEQRERDEAIIRFSSKCVSILVATDVAARGLDIEQLDLVINFQFSRDIDTYTHRIGRTGRAGNKGLACSIFIEKEGYKLAAIAESLGVDVEPSALPSYELLQQPTYYPKYACIQIEGGKRQKVRAGDILGALTSNKELDGKQIGKIKIFDNSAYVAVDAKIVKKALRKLNNEKMKGRSFRARWLK
jgi:ATP-independent RNA helicase DbpA